MSVILHGLPLEQLTQDSLRGIKSGNEPFAADVASWTFQESNVLRIESVAHHRVNETLPRETYTINDHVVSEFARWTSFLSSDLLQYVDVLGASVKIQFRNVSMGAVFWHQ